ncbi:hypothetical protein CONLIGDRAFT_635817 [Coniochaeta ligniaria NRRL 30616]|uniref:Uncharacterized protein n=1 Tax=Coniochaeta ligniaria NRRL 30616 TaxID=1408157 RepID=A0A1J7JEQ1_9PEZI|nr:hypothetical protein CONLIGDRAFT_635817 [Coniochaeta ligniaria NRRL 30616]
MQTRVERGFIYLALVRVLMVFSVSNAFASSSGQRSGLSRQRRPAAVPYQKSIGIVIRSLSVTQVGAG